MFVLQKCKQKLFHPLPIWYNVPRIMHCFPAQGRGAEWGRGHEHQMELNKKRLEIMLYLRHQQEFVSVEELAAQNGVSTRAMRYNLDAIELFLVKKGFPYLEKERLRGVRLARSAQMDAFIDECAATVEPYRYSYSPQERLTYILSTLLLAQAPVQIETYCKAIGCARNTVFKDLEQAEQWLAKRSLDLIKRPRVGMYITGSEARRRAALAELYVQSVGAQEVLRYVGDGGANSRFNSQLLQLLLDDKRTQLVEQTVKELEGALGRQFSDDTFGSLAIHLAVCLRRIEAGAAIPAITFQGDDLMESREYTAASQTLGALAARLELAFPPEELAYFTYHLMGARVLKGGGAEDAPEADEALLQVTRRMVREMEKIYYVDFGIHREALVGGIFTHLRPSINRIRYGLYIHNPLFDQIVSRYNTLFLNTRLVCQYLADYLGVPVGDQEIAYVALHFGAALHKINRKPESRVRVLLVCGTGLGSAMMITSQMEKLFEVEVTDTVSGRAVATMDLSQVDFIISTVPLPEVDQQTLIQVSPLFTEKDQAVVAERLGARPVQKARYDDQIIVAARLVKIVEKYGLVQDPVHLQYEFLSELMNSHQLDLRGKGQRLRDLLPREVIRLGVGCSDWREAVAQGTRILEERGDVTSRYKEAIIRNLEEYGPYMVMLPGMVLSHAGPEEGARRLAMSLVTLDQPVAFGYEEYDPVRIVITLAAVDQEQHLAALAQLFRILKNKECFERIAKATSRSEVARLVADHSN